METYADIMLEVNNNHHELTKVIKYGHLSRKRPMIERRTKKRAIVREPRPTQGSAVMTVREVATLLSCHTSTIYRLSKQGLIPGFRLGGNWRFMRSEIERWIKRQPAD